MASRAARAVTGGLLSALALAGCGSTTTQTQTLTVPAKPSTSANASTITPGGTGSSTTVLRTRSSTATTGTRAGSTRLTTRTRSTATASATATRGKPLAGKTVGVDPGHNGANGSDPSYINHMIWNGRQMETCNTTGTSTNGGYTEAEFNWNVANYLADQLRAQGARVVMTRHNNSGVGPCVNQRAAIVNAAHANVSVAIHSDGGPAGGRGFAVLLPVSDAENAASVSASRQFGTILRDTFAAGTSMPTSSYDGVNGLQPRANLGGLNLTRVPNVLLEIGNMRNSTDAALLITSAFQHKAAAALDQAIVKFLKASG